MALCSVLVSVCLASGVLAKDQAPIGVGVSEPDEARAAAELERLDVALRGHDVNALRECYVSVRESVTVPRTTCIAVAMRYRMAGRFSDARDVYIDLLVRDPNDEGARSGLVLTLFDMGDFRGASQFLEPARDGNAGESRAADGMESPVNGNVTDGGRQAQTAAASDTNAVAPHETLPELVEPPPITHDVREGGVASVAPPAMPLPPSEPLALPEAPTVPAIEDVAPLPPVEPAMGKPEPPKPEPPKPEPEKPEQAQVRVLKLFQDGMLDEAMSELDKALALYPADAGLLFTKAQVQRARQNVDGAMETCNRILELVPDDGNAKALKARLLVQQAAACTNGVAAVPLYEQALSLGGEDPDVRAAYTVALGDGDRAEDVVRSYELLPADFAKSDELLRVVAGAYSTLGRSEKVLALDALLFKNHPEDTALGRALIKLQVEAGLIEQAVATINTLIARHPDDAGLLFMLAELERDGGHAAEALTACNRVLAIAPGHAGAADMKVKLLLEQAEGAADAEGEAALLKDALAASGNADAIRDRYVGMLFELGRKKEAMANFEALPKGYDTSLETLRSVAKSYFDAKKFAEARPIYEAILAKAPEDQAALRGLVTILFNLGEYNRAVETLSRATLTPADLPVDAAKTLQPR